MISGDGFDTMSDTWSFLNELRQPTNQTNLDSGMVWMTLSVDQHGAQHVETLRRRGAPLDVQLVPRSF